MTVREQALALGLEIVNVLAPNWCEIRRSDGEVRSFTAATAGAELAQWAQNEEPIAVDVDSSSSTDAPGITLTSTADNACGECGWETNAKDPVRALRDHRRKEHS